MLVLVSLHYFTMESPTTPPRTPCGAKRPRSPSPRTPSPNRQEGTPQAPGAPERPSRRPRMDPTVAHNLSAAFDEAARQQEEAEEFLADQTGKEQQVPNSPSASDNEDEEGNNEENYEENEF